MPDREIPLNELRELLSGLDPEALLQALPVGGGPITILFTDIVGSTDTRQQVRDRAYFAALKCHDALIRECRSRHNGTEIETAGDAFVVVFADPAAAVGCAAEVQQRLAAEPIIVGDGPLGVRIGIHTGMPIVYRDPGPQRTRLSGNDVAKAARICAICGGGQVLISEQTRVFAGAAVLHDWGIWELKGLEGHRVFEVLYPGKVPELPAGRMVLAPLRFATSFVGREREIAALTEAVKDQRLITLTGMGGIGKTRLADIAARRLSDRFEDATYFVELAEIGDAESAVASELVAALAVNPASFRDEAEAVVKTLQNRHALLVLDNFEGVMAAAPLVRKLVLGCPRLHLLLTSQAPLNIDGEHLHPAPAMDAPALTADAASLARLDAFELFRERARARVPGWDVRSPEEVSNVAEILRLLDGIPLAIELAAAWADTRTLAEIKRGLANRFRLLRRRKQGETARHDSMHACLDYAVGLLAPQIRADFPKLAIFAGGFFAEDVAAVCGIADAGALLEALHERNLVLRQEIVGRSRYSLLATVRDFAAARLPKAKAEPLERAHARHFLRVLKSADAALGGGSYAPALDRIAADLANFEAGFANSRETGDHAAVFEYAAGLAAFLAIKGRFADRLRLLLAARADAEGVNPATMAAADNNLGTAFANLPTGDRGANLQRAIDCYTAALRVRTERDFPQAWAGTQNNLGLAFAELPTGDRGANLQRAIDCYTAALRVWTERDFPQDWAMTQNNLGTAFADLPIGDRGDNLQRAIDCHKAAARGYQTVGMHDEAGRSRTMAQRLRTAREPDASG